MNLITEYFTYSHLVNVIQQTESKGRYPGFSVSLSFMLHYFMLPLSFRHACLSCFSCWKRTISYPFPPPPPKKKISKAKLGLLAWKNSCSEQTLLSQPLTVGSHSVLLHPHPFSFYYSSSSLDLMWSFQRLCNQTSLSFVRNAVSIRMCILCFLTNGEGVFPSDLCRLIQCIFQLYCIH